MIGPIVSLLLSLFISQCQARSSYSDQEPLRSKFSRSHLALTNDLIGLHKNLTQIESITYNEKEVGEWLSRTLESQGYNVEKQYVDRESGRFNVFAYPGETSDARLLVTSHIDTVRNFEHYND